MMAEERGAEGTLKIGQGPVFRQRKAELQQLQDAAKIQEERVRDAQKRLQAVDTRLAQIEREVAAVDGDIAKLKGEADTAEQRIQVSQASQGADTGMPKVDPARVRAAFEKAQQEFRQEPTVEKLSHLASQCTQLLGAMAAAPATRDRVRDVDCDPKQAAEAASRVFALNAGLLTFATNCTGGAKLPTEGGTDALLSFGRKCLQDSGLPTADSNDMAARISAIDLNRDDKAHRFVVTWNAFADGNRLAYLSLAIAIALDSLIFMAGLFGANAVRSPLTEIDHHGEMSADQLEAAVDATLAQTIDPRGTLSALLGAMHPVRNVDGFASEIVLDERDPLVGEMRKVLNAGSNISAVQPVGHDRSRYLVHAGFTRYLTLAQRKPWKIKAAELDRKELINVIGVALLPAPGPQTNAEIVLGHMHPISDAQGFAAETSPFQIVEAAEKRLVLNVLGAGATVPGAVKRNNDDGRYFVSTDVYKTLLLMRAAAIPQFTPEAIERRLGGNRVGGHLSSAVPSIPLEGLSIRQIEDQTPRAASPAGRYAPQERKPGGNPRATSVPQGQPQPAITPATAPAAAPGMPPPLPSSSPPPRQAQSSRLASEIRAAIISHGLHPWSDQEIEVASHLLSQGRLVNAVTALIERAPILGQNAGEAVREFSALVDEAFEQLRDEHMADLNYVQVLESEAQKLKRLMPVLVMTPAGPYEQLIEAMIRELRTRGGILEDQAGSGRLTPEEIVQLRGFERHLYQIRQLPANAFTRDERLAAILDAYREDDTAADAPAERRDAPPLT